MTPNKVNLKALNHGIYNSTGQYIINIDSDGWLDKNAVKNIVRKFESKQQNNLINWGYFNRC